MTFSNSDKSNISFYASQCQSMLSENKSKKNILTETAFIQFFHVHKMIISTFQLNIAVDVYLSNICMAHS